MDIIVSHDVDHIGVREHLSDGILAKFLIRSGMELLGGRIRWREIAARARGVRGGKWNHTDAMMDFDERHGIPSTFFFGMANGLGLSYGLEAAAEWVGRVESRGFKTGVHGICFDDAGGIAEERRRFAEIRGCERFGIRMHYLRSAANTEELLAEAGYLYDATPYRGGDPWTVGAMTVFPLHAMDGRFLQEGRFGVQTADYEGALERAKAAMRAEASAGTKHFSLLFHDRYFCDEFETWRRWYEELIAFAESEGHSFASYEEILRGAR